MKTTNSIRTRRPRSRLAALGCAALVAAGLTVATPGAARAATISVPCSGPNGGAAGLIAAINTANGNRVDDTIALSPLCTYTLTTANNNTNGPTGLPAITSDITIDGNGATIRRSPATGTPDFRIFLNTGMGDLTLSRVNVRDGRAPSGGGIASFGGELEVDNSVVRGNTATNPVAGWNGAGGGIVGTDAEMTLTGTTVFGNTAHGGSVGTGGGVAAVDGSLRMTRSTVQGNSATGVDGAQGGGVWAAFGSTLTASRTTVTGNTATGPIALGGGVVADGGGTAEFGTLSRIAGNITTATTATGQAQGGGIFNSAPMTLRSTVVTANVARATQGGGSSGGGVFNTGTLTRPLATIAGNIPDNCVNSGAGTGC
jgi:hypothetical protein